MLRRRTQTAGSCGVGLKYVRAGGVAGIALDLSENKLWRGWQKFWEAADSEARGEGVNSVSKAHAWIPSGHHGPRRKDDEASPTPVAFSKAVVKTPKTRA